MPEPLLDALLDWLRIPSISTGGGDPADLQRAAQWAADRVVEAGGEAELVTVDGSNPIVVGELRSDDADAPTVLVYGHYDVQGAGDEALWTTPAFEPTIRDERIWARGAADDKGNFWPLLAAACALKREGELPVHVRVCCEGEEEAGSHGVIAWLREDEVGADAAIVFDSGMVDPQTPAITLGLRGVVQATFTVTTGERDLHSGIYGGTALNPLHVVTRMLAAVVPGPDGVLREELREGVLEPAAAELRSWEALPTGAEVLGEAGAREAYPGAAGEYYRRNGADAALDVNEVVAGEPRTVIPRSARATVSLRLAPGQEPGRMQAVLEGLLRDAAPAEAELEFRWHSASPALFPVDEPAIQLAAGALERAVGKAPAFLRSGGSIPIVAELAAKEIPTIVSGFVLPDDAFHAPDESFSLRGLELGERAGRELLKALAELPR
ncbi:M20/M25/M40 family metallo-hydrolase [Conexibacter sp. SYSU D00693]|uniref:M20/M25/M40 family metallo-hydrolase n=1 Tax=Conexibacter sp. SYSU D00693 TaxID=2812560 RepID=UPI00196ADD64|nr:M20/M25/M40 family metallo-hydrolase [Conexibacter sp. SYSU D00693]